MSVRKHHLIPGNIYHVYNRGVEKRQIFLSRQDYLRFVKGLVVFNDSQPMSNFEERFQSVFKGQHKRKPLVDVLAFCLMQNHYHLLLKQKTENGITEFMHKLGDGYAKYFNLKAKRVGALFQGKFQSVWIGRNRHFLYIPHYIHLNPLDLEFTHWRERPVKNRKEVLDFLKNYEWSSYNDYVGGNNNFDLVLNKNLIKEYFNAKEYQEDLEAYLRDFMIEDISEITLE
jgi:putative transposase